jgi:hypothetical protein
MKNGARTARKMLSVTYKALGSGERPGVNVVKFVITLSQIFANLRRKKSAFFLLKKTII